MRVRRLALIFVALVVLVVCSAAFAIAEDIARDNLIIKEKEVPVERIVVETETIYVEKEVDVYWLQFYATGYSPDDSDQGTNRTMASGKEVYEGAIAADPTVLSLGTKLEIRGLPNGKDGKYTVEDTGEVIEGLRIDVFCESYLEALQINQMVWARVLGEDD